MPSRGVARGGVLGCPWPPLGRPSFEQTTYNIQMAKTPWQYLGRKSHCWKAYFFKICFFVNYFRQRLLSLVNIGLHAAIPLSPLIHEGEQRYTPYIVLLGLASLYKTTKHLTYTVYAFARVWHILSKGQFDRGKDNNKLLIGTSKTGDHCRGNC